MSERENRRKKKSRAHLTPGGLLGMAFGRFLPERFQDILTKACGVSVLFLGIAEAMAVVDLIIVMVMTCSQGKGRLFSAVPVGSGRGW